MLSPLSSVFQTHQQRRQHKGFPRYSWQNQGHASAQADKKQEPPLDQVHLSSDRLIRYMSLHWSGTLVMRDWTGTPVLRLIRYTCHLTDWSGALVLRQFSQVHVTWQSRYTGLQTDWSGIRVIWQIDQVHLSFDRLIGYTCLFRCTWHQTC